MNDRFVARCVARGKVVYFVAGLQRRAGSSGKRQGLLRPIVLRDASLRDTTQDIPHRRAAIITPKMSEYDSFIAPGCVRCSNRDVRAVTP